VFVEWLLALSSLCGSDGQEEQQYHSIIREGSNFWHTLILSLAPTIKPCLVL